MIKLKDRKGNSFYLMLNRCRDNAFVADIFSVKAAIEEARNSKYRDSELFIDGFSPYVSRHVIVVVTFIKGELKLGCHRFDKKNTKRILKWAGVKL